MSRSVRLRVGWQQSVAALTIAIGAAVVIAVPTWSRSQTAGRLAIGGVVLFVIALILGSGRLVAITSVVILGAGLVSLTGQDTPAWTRGMAVGVLWYIAAELAWDSIERRNGVRRTSAYNSRRIDETSKVVFISLIVSAVAVAVSGVAPARTILMLAIVMVGISFTLASQAQTLRTSGSDELNETEMQAE